MAIDPTIKSAIELAVAEEGQSENLARRIISWFDAITSGQENIDDIQDVARRLYAIYEETIIDDHFQDEVS